MDDEIRDTNACRQSRDFGQYVTMRSIDRVLFMPMAHVAHRLATGAVFRDANDFCSVYSIVYRIHPRQTRLVNMYIAYVCRWTSREPGSSEAPERDSFRVHEMRLISNSVEAREKHQHDEGANGVRRCRKRSIGRCTVARDRDPDPAPIAKIRRSSIISAFDIL
jgi:hypothetical protein